MIIISGTINDGTQIGGKALRVGGRGTEEGRGKGARNAKGRKVLPIITYN